MNKPSIRRQIITLWRICVAGFHNLFRNLWLTTAGVAIMTVTLTIVLSSIVANAALQETIDSVAKDLTISIFLEDDAPEDKQDQLLSALENTASVESVNFKSKAAALSDFQAANADNPDLLAGIDIAEDNVFPASYEITLGDISRYEQVVNLANSEGFDEVVYRTSDNKSRESFDTFISAKNFITKASIVAGGIFGAISMLIIFNTIRMAIFTRSQEIEIMKLIGATPGYIRGPFLFEASLYGIIAGLLTLSLVYSTLVTLSGSLSDYLTIQQTTDFLIEYWYVVFALVVGIGVLLGFVSSVIAMARYLRIKKW